MISIASLFNAKKHASVISLINAFGTRTFENKNLKDVAIRSAFHQGTTRNVKSVVEKLHDNPAITHVEYVNGLIESWVHDKSKLVFPFLLAKADKGDLTRAKNDRRYMINAKFRQAIDDAMKTAPSEGTRHGRFFERAKLGINTLDEVTETGKSEQESGKIDASHLVGEQEAKTIEKRKSKKEKNVTSKSKRKKSQRKQIKRRAKNKRMWDQVRWNSG